MVTTCRFPASLTKLMAVVALTGTLACSDSTCDTVQLGTQATAMVQRMHVRNPAPGISVAMVAPDRFGGVVTAVAGTRSFTPPTALVATDRFLAGSVGKMFFAGLALRYVSRGRLPLDAPIASYVTAPDIAAFGWITPRMLLTHTSGIGEYDGPFMESLIREPLRERVANDWLDVIRRQPPVRGDTGTFRYSDLNYVVLAMVLDAVDSTSAYDAIERDIISPLQLHATAPSVKSAISQLVDGYDGDRSMFGQDAMNRDGTLIYNPQFEWGGGGFVTTPTDLAQFMAAFRRGRVFPDSLWSMATAKPNGVADTARHWRGMGVHVDSTALGYAYGHSGYMPGYVSWVRWYESLGVGVAMQVNASDQARLVDDGFDWLDSLATVTAAQCHARTGQR